MSSLANQLKNIASLDAARLTSKSGAPTSKSYLFPPKVASTHDLDAIFSLAQSGFEELLNLDPDMAEFEDELFSERSRRTDRMLLTKKENQDLDEILGRCLRRLGKWIGIMAGGKCIEWLVRRFRIHEMNAETVLQVFLPYHQSPNYPRMLAILAIPQTSTYHAPFQPLIKNAQPIPRSYITTMISPAKDKSLRLLIDVAGMVQRALAENVIHRCLLTFWSATMVELIQKEQAGTTKAGQEGLVKVLVEAFVGVLSTQKAGLDANAAVYPPLILLTRTIRLVDEPFLAILSALLTPGSGADPAQRVLTLLFLLNDRQGWSLGLGQHGATGLAKIPDLGNLLVSGIDNYGFEQAVQVIVSVMLDSPLECRSPLWTLVSSSALNDAMVTSIATRLLDTGSSSDDPTRSACKAILAALVERRPAEVNKSRVSLASAGSNIDSSLIDDSSKSMAFVNAYSADSAARIKSIPTLMSVLNPNQSSKTAASQADRQEALEKFQALLGDQDEAVVTALYDRSDDEQIAFDNACSSIDFIDAIKASFIATPPGSRIRTKHIEYLTSHLLNSKPSFSKTLVQNLVFPLLLRLPGVATLTPQELAKLLPIHEGKSTGVADPILAFDSSSDKSPKSDMKRTAHEYNTSIVNSLAERMTFFEPLKLDKFLVSQLEHPDASGRILAHLALTHRVNSLRGDHQVRLATAIVPHLDRMLQGGPLGKLEQSAATQISEVLNHIHERPGDAVTGRRLALHLLSALRGVTRPPGLMIDWMSEELSSDSSTTQSSFRFLAQAIYRYANSDNLPSDLAKTLLHSVLTQVGEDALGFFASIWTSSMDVGLRIAALRHATAFIQAYTPETDFQLVLPSLLISFTDVDKHVRNAAGSLLRSIAKAYQGQSTSFYALNSFYGDRSKLVQLLKPNDLSKYLHRLSAAVDELVLDPGRFLGLQTSILGTGHGQGRKETGHRRAVIGSLLSHVQANLSLRQRTILLQSLSGVRDGTVIRHILPLFATLDSESSDEGTWLAKHPLSETTRYLVTVTDTLSAQSVSSLQDIEDEPWKALVRWLRPSQSPFSNLLRDLLLQRMAKGVFDHLHVEQRVTYFCEAVRSIHDLDESITSASTTQALRSFNLDATSLILIIDGLSQPLSEPTQHTKRQKQDETSSTSKLDDTVADLTVLIESRDWKKVAGDAPLVAALMSILSGLLSKRQSIKEGVDYLEQEVLGAILVLVEKIQDPSEIQKSHIGVEVVVKVIRASSNPRTSQRALLVASELARLIPDAVLHNVMPIFTFMGASDFQRDDAYSFGVVEKTVARIVPVMTKSLKDKATTKLELYNESLTFISIFTDMAGRLPRHRTLPFFVHLVQSLGSSEYLPAVSMLLVDRTTTKAGRSTGQSIDLPLGLAGFFDIDTRLNLVLEVIQEVSRLVPDLTNPDKGAFLSRLLNDDTDSDRTLRQISTLLQFIIAVMDQLTGRACPQERVEDIVQELIVLGGVIRSLSLSSTGLGEVVEKAIFGSMQLLAAEGFLRIIMKLLEGNNHHDSKIALELLVERLPSIKPAVRSKATSTVIRIIHTTGALLSNSSIVDHALEAIRVIATGPQSSEDPALSQIVPKIVALLQDRSGSVVITALSLLELLTRHLASRVIPHLNSLIDSYLKAATSSAAIAKQAFTSLATTIDTVPSFISTKQLTSCLKAAVEYRATDKDASNPVLSTTAKKVSTKALLPVVMDLWKQLQDADAAVMGGFFHLLRLTIRHAERTSLPSLIKPIFAFFLDIFDLRHRLQKQNIDQDTINSIEESAIGSFLELVTKLNEMTFKPLFIRLYDWAVIDLAEDKPINDPRLVERKIVLLHVMMGLLNKFQHLLSPYIGTMLPHIEELLPAYASGEIKDEPLWSLLLDVLAKSFEVDDGAYWTDALHIKLIPHLISQLPLFPNKTTPQVNVISSLAGSTTSTPTLKLLNTSILLATRSDEPQTRLTALKVLEGVWTKQPDEMLQFVPETVSEFLSELLEDENSDVEIMARKVLSRIEGLSGNLKEYLE